MARGGAQRRWDLPLAPLLMLCLVLPGLVVSSIVASANHDATAAFLHGLEKTALRVRTPPTAIAVGSGDGVPDLAAPECLSAFSSVLEEISLSDPVRSAVVERLLSAGFASSDELTIFASDFLERPEALSSVLRDDFGFENPYQAHMARAALLKLVRRERDNARGNEAKVVTVEGGTSSIEEEPMHAKEIDKLSSPADVIVGRSELNGGMKKAEVKKERKKRPLFKSVVVNTKAKKRHRQGGSKDEVQYGLPSNYASLFPSLASELDDFMIYMTQPSASSQEPPVREETATVYIRHAKLFLGWFLKKGKPIDDIDTGTLKDSKEGNNSKGGDGGKKSHEISINLIFPTKEAQTAQPIVDFVLWLRRTRDISDSYEANVLRGLTKLLKFRFSSISQADPSYGEKSYGDIPAVRELRKLHRDANRRQARGGTRSSDEESKWLSWTEYLEVVEGLGRDVHDNIKALNDSELDKIKETSNTPAQRRIATLYQKYLVLAIFACVPDRQRTIRELELGRTFLRTGPTSADPEKEPSWIIKHGPDDYKTGSSYGDRPPLVLSPHLTPQIDDFLYRWRPALNPSTDCLFAQPRTGKPLTRDSVYSIVARSCYERTGKKTNPHLLRDMIVTHIRGSADATERDLEALALYMGHSVNMQRNSYDRRTAGEKVAPAVELLRSVNNKKK